VDYFDGAATREVAPRLDKSEYRDILATAESETGKTADVVKK
jgi:hypothetical protein